MNDNTENNINATEKADAFVEYLRKTIVGALNISYTCEIDLTRFEVVIAPGYNISRFFGKNAKVGYLSRFMSFFDVYSVVFYQAENKLIIEIPNIKDEKMENIVMVANEYEDYLKANSGCRAVVTSKYTSELLRYEIQYACGRDIYSSINNYRSKYKAAADKILRGIYVGSIHIYQKGAKLVVDIPL